jgi:hypothetical protein
MDRTVNLQKQNTKKYKIGSITPLYNGEPFIIPHFNMLSSLDKNIVLLGDNPLPQYEREHGYSKIKDRSKELLCKYFPKVEIYPSTYTGEWGAPLLNEGLKYVQDCDKVFLLGVDMIFSDDDWKKINDFIQETSHDCYIINFGKCSINYYMDFNHGLKDAKEFDPIVIDPKKKIDWVYHYPAENQYIIEWDNFCFHHFKGWNKPKTVTKDWPYTEYAKTAFLNYSNNGDWYSCPQEIRDKFDKETADVWLKKIKT